MFSLLLLLACATDGTNSGSYSNSNLEDANQGPTTEELKGGYENCNQALVGLGFTPWTNYTEWQDAVTFEVDVDTDQFPDNYRPWIANLSFDDTELGYKISCKDSWTSAARFWADPNVDEYWSCLFQGDFIGILDPESDPECSVGIIGGIRILSADAQSHDLEWFTLIGPGHLVPEEE